MISVKYLLMTCYLIKKKTTQWSPVRLFISPYPLLNLPQPKRFVLHLLSSRLRAFFRLRSYQLLVLFPSQDWLKMCFSLFIRKTPKHSIFCYSNDKHWVLKDDWWMSSVGLFSEHRWQRVLSKRREYHSLVPVDHSWLWFKQATSLSLLS